MPGNKQNTISDRADPYRGHTPRSHVLALLGAVVLGIVSYVLLVQWAYRHLETAIQEADVVSTILAKDLSRYEHSDAAGERESYLRFVTLMGSLGVGDSRSLADAAQTDPDSPPPEEWNLVWYAVKNVPGGLNEQRESVDLLANILDRNGDQSSNIAVGLMRSIANRPVGFGLDAYGAAWLASLQGSQEYKSELEPNVPAVPLKGYFSVVRPIAPSDRALLEQLFNNLGWTSPNWCPKGNLASAIERGDCAKVDAVLQGQLLGDFATALLSEIRADERVRHAAFWVTLWHGWPQLFMIILAIYALWWLWPRLVGAYLDREAVREAQRDRQASERGGNQPAKSDSEATQEGVPIRYRRPLPNRVYEKGTMELRDRGGERAAAWRAEIDAHAARLKALGWPIRLSAGLIPMFGFIGTVLGIMEALGRSDVIVRASSVTDQAAAVLDVAGALGLAFGTTAIALALGIVLRLLLGLAEGWEDEWTTSMDTEIAPWAEPAARK